MFHISGLEYKDEVNVLTIENQKINLVNEVLNKVGGKLDSQVCKNE
jgi:hypothetical protein